MVNHLSYFYIEVIAVYLMSDQLMRNCLFENFEHYCLQSQGFISYQFCDVIDLLQLNIFDFAIEILLNLNVNFKFVKHYYFDLSIFNLMLAMKKILLAHLYYSSLC